MILFSLCVYLLWTDWKVGLIKILVKSFQNVKSYFSFVLLRRLMDVFLCVCYFSICLKWNCTVALNNCNIRWIYVPTFPAEIYSNFSKNFYRIFFFFFWFAKQKNFIHWKLYFDRRFTSVVTWFELWWYSLCRVDRKNINRLSMLIQCWIS